MDEDRAVVVGIARYPQFGSDGTKSNDLQGPVKDAVAMADWLVGDAKAHVTLITSDGQGDEKWTVTDRRPNRQDLEDGFAAYVSESLAKPIRRIGRRLYVYMAGHGFMPEPRHLALITANALSDVSVPNIQATSWIDWFADQLYFDEYVLWMDCCAIRTFSYEGGKPLMKKGATRQDGRARVFMGFAAGPSLTAFEGPIGPQGEVRGLFTDRLLRGLKGAAADAAGTVRTSDLVAYLSNQKALTGEGIVRNSAAAPQIEPVFPETAELVLAQVGSNLPAYDIRVPVADGERLRVIEVRQGEERVVAEGVVANGTARLQLAVGIYRASAPGFTRLFEIASGTSDEVRLA